jgi:hypothetical protein
MVYSAYYDTFYSVPGGPSGLQLVRLKQRRQQRHDRGDHALVDDRNHADSGVTLAKKYVRRYKIDRVRSHALLMQHRCAIREEVLVAGKKTTLALWEAFQKRYKKHPSFALDPLYALPQRLITLLGGFFKGPDREFETALARVTSGGISGGAPFVEVLLEEPADDDLAPVQQELHDLRRGELAEHGLNPTQIRRYFEVEAKQKAYALLRTRAYAGWLIGNLQFRAERDALRQQSGTLMEAGHFPRLPRSFFGEEHEPEVPEPFLWFYRRWGLETFVTWDLPLPMGPELQGSTSHETFTMSAAGLNIFLPWHLLRDRKFSLAEVADHLRAWQNPWMDLRRSRDRREHRRRSAASIGVR